MVAKTFISIVIPVYNEEESILKVIEEIQHSLINYSFEIIIVNDCSNDKTKKIIQKSTNLNYIKIIDNQQRKGQSFSLYSGIKAAKSNIIVTLDGDGQNNPKDIPDLLEKFFSNMTFKLVGGIRKKRKDSFLKIASSRIANKIRSIILKDNCEDTGCSLKVFDKSIFLNFPFFDG